MVIFSGEEENIIPTGRMENILRFPTDPSGQECGYFDGRRMPERGRTYECFVWFGMCKVIDYYCIIVKKERPKELKQLRL